MKTVEFAGTWNIYEMEMCRDLGREGRFRPEKKNNLKRLWYDL